MKFSAVVPLIGGFPIGAAQALGTKPTQLLSYEAFAANDHFASKYFNLPIEQLNQAEKVDVVIATPPCAGLSLGNPKHNSGSATNDWIIKSTADTLGFISPELLIGENAPGLATKMGQPVRQRLEAIVNQFGYYVQYIQTDTQLHGIPQRRKRTFYVISRKPLRQAIEFTPTSTPSLREFCSSIEQQGGDLVSFTSEEWLGIKLWGERAGWDTHTYATRAAHKSTNLATWLAHNYKQGDTALDVLDSSNVLRRSIDRLHAKPGGVIWDNTPRIFDPRGPLPAWMYKCFRAVHPYELRPFRMSEALAFMGLPLDYLQWLTIKDTQKTSQTVPTTTAARVVTAVVNAYM